MLATNQPTRSGRHGRRYRGVLAGLGVAGLLAVWASPAHAWHEGESAADINGRTVKDFVSSECGGCHNPKRTGATGPDITQERLKQGIKNDEGEYKTSSATGRPLTPMSKEAIFATTKHGRPNTSMPAWGTSENPIGQPLSDAEIKAISEYLWNNAAPEEFVWGMANMRASHEVLVAPADKPDKPTHDWNVDDLLLVTEREHFGVAVIDGDKLEVAAHLRAGARAHGYTFSPDGRYAYNLGRDGWLYKYDLYMLEATRRVRLGMDARGIAIDDKGEYLLTGMYIPTQAVVVDAETLEPLKLIDTHDVEGPEGKPVDSRICTVNDVRPSVGPYFLMALKEAGQVWRVNYAEDDFPVTKVKDVGRILHDGFLRPDNEVFYLASQTDDHMAAIDVASMETIKKIKTGKKPHPGPGAIWHADGTQYAATPHIGDNKNVIWDTRSQEIVGEVKSDAPGLFVRAHPKMKYVWFDSMYPPAANQITVHKKSKPFEVVKRIEEGTLTLHPEPDADGDYVFVSDWKEGVVRVYDDETLEKVKTLKDIKTPTGIFSVHRAKEHEGH